MQYHYHGNLLFGKSEVELSPVSCFWIMIWPYSMARQPEGQWMSQYDALFDHKRCCISPQILRLIKFSSGPSPCSGYPTSIPSDWKRPTVRPSHTWLRAIEADPLNFGLATAWRKATTRDEWWHIMDTATLQWSTLWKEEVLDRWVEPQVWWNESGYLAFQKADCPASSVCRSNVLLEDKELVRDLTHDRQKLLSQRPNGMATRWWKNFEDSFWQNVRTWWTHRHTPHDSIGRACKASRGKNYCTRVLTCSIKCVKLI